MTRTFSVDNCGHNCPFFQELITSVEIPSDRKTVAFIIPQYMDLHICRRIERYIEHDKSYIRQTEVDPIKVKYGLNQTAKGKLLINEYVLVIPFPDWCPLNDSKED